MAEFNGPWPEPVARLGLEPVMDLGPGLLIGAATRLMRKLRDNPQGRTGRQIYGEATDRAVAKAMKQVGLPPPHTRAGYEALDLSSKVLLNRALINAMCNTELMAKSMNEPWYPQNHTYDTPSYDRFAAAKLTWLDPAKEEAWAADL